MSSDSSNKAVLIIDDDESIREYLRLILEEAGYTAIALCDGRTALAYLSHASVDLILLDLMMPVFDGWQVVAALDADARLRKIPVVVFSAIGDRAPPPAAATLVKPTGLDEVLSVVERLLPRGDRRRSPRYPARFELVTEASPGPISATTRDVSRRGLCFDVSVPLPVGERVILTVDLAVHGAATVEAEIRHAKAVDGGWRVGAELLAFHHNGAGFDEELALLAASTRPR